MSTGRADLPVRSRARGLTGRLLGLLLLATPLTACSDDRPPPAPPAAATASSQVQEEVARTLRRRGRAVAEGDRRLFGRTLLREDATFVEEQETYFANLRRLPLVRVGFELDSATLVADGEDYWGEVDVTLRLRRFDEGAVRTRDRFRFSPSRDGRRYLVSSTTDEEWESGHDVAPQPWDLGPIRVRRDSGVLGILDRTTLDGAADLLDAASFARFDVAAEVPDAELPDVTVYATGDLSYLEQVPGLPVADPDRLDAVTIPVVAEPGSGEVAAYRVMVHPRVLAQDLPLLDRLLRHELTHVVVGQRADGAPLWLSEGIAEWVSVQPVARDERRLPAESLALAEGGLSELPEDAAFGGADARAWYGVAWWICEYVATTYDRSYLWRLLDETAGDGDAAAAIEELLDLTPSELVSAAMELMQQQYAPDPPPETTPVPTTSPTAPATPTTPTTPPTATPTAPATSPGASPTPIEPPDRGEGRGQGRDEGRGRGVTQSATVSPSSRD
ncbi:hypothetical protein KUV85_03955 [Nocardioides panacisoli]|uniref:hypothetical protein n=1 Tax=Nocardioides panacisoli TaxID=627624 RepID=UPI001C63604F|nr:hypothetical protein [Nocardioides panacisoli]QYJ04848.1 hypothetical protein KUV85_03955 [Nocardioides panacisoli]